MKVDRRMVLRGFAGAAIAMPWLEGTHGTAHAQTADGPKRFVLFFDHGGTLCATDKGGKKFDGNGPQNGVDAWVPLPGAELKLGAIHAASLQPFADSLLVLRGIDNAACAKQSPYNGDHGWANVTALTCANVTLSGKDSYTVDGPSIDAVLATRLAQKNPVTFPSINLEVPAHNYGTPFYRAANQPVGGDYNPVTAFDKLFAGVTTGPVGPDAATLRARALKKSVLDGVGEGLTRFQNRVSANDRRSIEAHLEHIRSLEKQLQGGMVSAGCTKPTVTGIDPKADQYSVDIEKSGPAMVDILIAALRCGLTNVGTVNIGGLYAKFLNPTFPAAYDIGHSLDHSSRDVGKTGPDGAKWQAWYDTMLKNRQWRIGLVARLLAGLAATREGSGTMLDNTLLLSTSEFSCGAVHSVADMPILLAGKAGGRLKTARQINFNLKAASNPATLDYQTQSSLHNLYTSILNIFGYADTNFGSTGHAWKIGPLDLS
jgi:hypothetical protein